MTEFCHVFFAVYTATISMTTVIYTSNKVIGFVVFLTHKHGGIPPCLLSCSNFYPTIIFLLTNMMEFHHVCFTHTFYYDKFFGQQTWQNSSMFKDQKNLSLKYLIGQTLKENMASLIPQTWQNSVICCFTYPNFIREGFFGQFHYVCGPKKFPT